MTRAGVGAGQDPKLVLSSLATIDLGANTPSLHTAQVADNGGIELNGVVSGTGAGTVSLDGLFTFDLTTASTTINDSWNIVDVANLTESFGSNFSILGFTADGGGILWNGSANGASYQFSETTGVLTVIPEPDTAAVLGGLGMLGLLRRRRLG